MRVNHIYFLGKSTLILAILLVLNNSVTAQDSSKATVADTVKPTTAASSQVETKKKKKDQFIIYGGVNFNDLGVTSTKFEQSGGVGYHLGVAYRRGSFFYWQIGARYNSAAYNFKSTSTSTDTTKLTVNAIDLPLTAGVNFLSFANRLAALRLFVSAVPSFNIGVADNELNITKDNINSFVMYGQAGLGVDVAFVIIEAGYNYGFQDLLKNYSNSNPGQVFVSVGFRF